MEAIAQQVQKLREEIAMHDTNMMHGVYLIVVLMIGVHLAKIVTNNKDAAKLVLMLAAGTPYFVARQDYMIHRAAAWILMAEAKLKLQDLREKYPPGSLNEPRPVQTQTVSDIESWESWKANLKSRLIALPILDLLSPIAVMYIIFCSASFLWPTDRQFVITTCGMFVAGIGVIPVVIKFAGK
jgi:hypothetical protein